MAGSHQPQYAAQYTHRHRYTASYCLLMFIAYARLFIVARHLIAGPSKYLTDITGRLTGPHQTPYWPWGYSPVMCPVRLG